jgi:uncharacterized protein
MRLNSSKIINDPVHGFIEIPQGTLLALIDHPVYQRLRNIRQLGLSSLVYPGANHTRFHHALGAMHLMSQALDVLRRKQHEITDKEYEAALIAILLHDIGHGPFSHALEKEIIRNLHHEDMSKALMEYLNVQFKGELSLAIEIFEGKYAKNYLHQLVSSQLDMDRMDYLMRDSFFTGVVEGIVGADRIIKTLNVWENRLVVEAKGIYSVEKFIVARRLMYWQVYLHKANVSAENMLIKILRRLRKLYEKGVEVFLGDMLGFFVKNPVHSHHLNNSEVLERFIQLDDTDILYGIKQWQFHSDRVLSDLCKRILYRKLLKTHFRNEPFSEEEISEKRAQFCQETGYSMEEAEYFVFAGEVANRAYDKGAGEPILIWSKHEGVTDLGKALNMEHEQMLSKVIVKYFLISAD